MRSDSKGATTARQGPQKIVIYEVGLRDGLQNEAAFVPTEEKLALATALADAGLTRIELTSFVSPRWIPQLADHATVAREAPRRPELRYSALVPNLRGLEGAHTAGLNEIALFLSATEEHSKKNINKSIAEALQVLSDVAKTARTRGMRFRGYVSTAFFCPFQGPVDPGQVTELAAQLLGMGAEEVSLGDTIGAATPKDIRRLLSRLEPEISLDHVALHLHDTRGTALANVLAGLDRGVTTFDSAFGGLGGCPYAPGASGNLATEDLVYMLAGMGYETGVDLNKLVEASMRAADAVRRTLPSKVLQTEIAQRHRKND